jgi:GTP-binding protein Era
MTQTEQPTYCGFITIVGRPNVGKSSLMNVVMSKKISITCFRAQTTRHQILAIKTVENRQTVFVDTPGIHFNEKKALNRQMNKAAIHSMEGIDGAIMVVEALVWQEEDAYIAEQLAKHTQNLIIAINKIDLVPKKDDLLAFMQMLGEKFPHAQILPISVRKKIQLDKLLAMVQDYLPESPFYYPADQVMHQSDAFYVTEIVREKVMRLLAKEIPYSTQVEVEAMTTKNKVKHIHALIWVEREGQRKIMIGADGEVLKAIGTAARLDLERYFNQKVCLKLWIKVKEGWSDSPELLQSLGYHA